MNNMVITCAVTGAETTRVQNRNLPVTPEEIADSAYEAFVAGAAILHLHVRDAESNPSQSVETFRKTIELVRKKCDIVIEITTGGAVGMSIEKRMAPLELEPEIASLDCGTVNFGDDYIVNTLPMIRECARRMKALSIRPTLECFDLSHIDAAQVLIDEGIVEPPFHYGLVFGIPGGVRYDPGTLSFFIKRLPPDSYWTVIGAGGRTSMQAQMGALAFGGFMRVGFEDNVYCEKGVLADSNAQLVERASRLARNCGYEIAGSAEVREMFELRGYRRS